MPMTINTRNATTKDAQETLEAAQAELARQRVADAGDVPELCTALNEFECLRKKTGCDDIETCPVFDEDYYRDDWSDFADDPVSVDDRYVLFRERGGSRYYFMERCDFEDDGDQ